MLVNCLVVYVYCIMQIQANPVSPGKMAVKMERSVWVCASCRYVLMYVTTWQCGRRESNLRPVDCRSSVLSITLPSHTYTYYETKKHEGYNLMLLSSFVQHLFSVSQPDAWNSLSRELRGIAVASTFISILKAELFSRAYGVSLADLSVIGLQIGQDIFERGVSLTLRV